MQICKTVTYTVDDKSLPTIIKAVKEFTNAITSNEPETHYEAFQIEESNQFIHIMRFKNEQLETAHKEAEYTERFVETLYPACLTEPHFTDLNIIGDVH